MKTLPIAYFDGGHGGHDSGALGPTGLRESDMALDTCLRAQRLLIGKIDVRLTRDDDTFIELSERPRIANRGNADLFVSFHYNSGSSQNTASSWEIFTTPGQNNSDKLATMIGEEMMNLPLGQSARTDMSDGDLDKEANFTVIRGTDCPSCLVEFEFIHTTHGEALISNPRNRQLWAQAVAMGCCRFLGVDWFEDSQPPVEPTEALTVEQRLDRIEDQLGIT